MEKNKPKTAAELKAAERKRKRAQGRKGYEIWPHIDDWPKIKAFIKRLTDKRKL